MNDTNVSENRPPDRGPDRIADAWQQVESARARAQAAAAPRPADSGVTGLAGDSVAGYQILRELHRGGQGVVYLAIQQSTGRKVALKVMREGPFAGAADRVRFDREVHVLGQLNHPHIVAIHDSGAVAGHHYFVMDYVPGEPLDVYMAGAEHTVDETLRLFRKICEAVNTAHLHGVIHRDLKPGNIRIDPDGEPHVLDFGLAKVATGTADSSGMTLTGQFVGSLPWASPEQAEGAPHKIDVRTDVYSLGVILYQMLTRRFPYEVIGPTRNVLENILTVEPARPSKLGWHGRPGRGINDEVDTIVLKCLQKEPVRRYQTAGEVGRDVGHYLAGEPIEAKRDSLTYLFRKQLSRYKLPAATAAGFVVVITVGLIASLTFWQQAAYERDRAEANAERTAIAAGESKAVARFTQEMLYGISPEVAGELDKTLMRLILDDAARRIEQELNDQPLVAAALRGTIGRAYRAIGEYDRAQPHLEEALALRRIRLGEEHPDTLAAMSDLAALCYDQSRFVEAEDLHQRALDARRRVLGGEHPDTLASMSDLARVWYEVQTRYDEAERLLQQVLETQRRVLGDEHRDLFLTRNHLGSLYWRAGALAKAEPLFRQTLEAQQKVDGERHHHTLFTMNNLALVLQDLGKGGEAEELFRRTLQTRLQLLGAEHSLTLASMSNLALLLERRLEYDEAERLLRQALETQRRVQGAGHVETLRTMSILGVLLDERGEHAEAEELHREGLTVLQERGPEQYALYFANNLALNLQKQSRYAEAEELFRRTLARRCELLGPEHGLTLATMSNLAAVLQRRDEYDEAEQLLQQAFETQRRVQGVENLETLRTMSILGVLLDERGKHAEAEKLHRAGLKVLQERGPEQRALSFANNLALNLQKQGKCDEAESLFVQAVEGRRRLLGEEDGLTLATVCNLGDLYLEWGRYEEAELQFRAVVETAEKTRPANDTSLAAYRSGWGMCLTRVREYERAQDELLASYTVLSAGLGEGHKYTRRAIERLAELYDTWDAAEPGQGHDVQAAAWRAKLEAWRSSTQPATTEGAANSAPGPPVVGP